MTTNEYDLDNNTKHYTPDFEAPVYDTPPHDTHHLTHTHSDDVLVALLNVLSMAYENPKLTEVNYVPEFDTAFFSYASSTRTYDQVVVTLTCAYDLGYFTSDDFQFTHPRLVQTFTAEPDSVHKGAFVLNGFDDTTVCLIRAITAQVPDNMDIYKDYIGDEIESETSILFFTK